MNNNGGLKLLFLINPGAGKRETNWPAEIRKYFSSSPHDIELFNLTHPCKSERIKEEINKHKPDRVVAVGGDGTVKLTAESVMSTNIPVCILPAGSANGMAKELGIPIEVKEALELTVRGVTKKISLLRINNELCIHLSDIGFNAFVVKKFQTLEGRGMWGYIKASWKVLWDNTRMTVRIKTDTEVVEREAVMVVAANATRYGSGAVINPKGRLDDDLFEVVVVKKISFTEIFKMMVSHKHFDPKKIELFQTHSLRIESEHKAHFQVDGEYLGKVNSIEATILPNAVNVVVPGSE